MYSTPGAIRTAKNQVIFPFTIDGPNIKQIPTRERTPPASSQRQPAKKPPTIRASPTKPTWTIAGCVKGFGIPSPMAMITMTATANALTIRATQRHKVAARLVVFMDAGF
jgi:hypothetical protein